LDAEEVDELPIMADYDTGKGIIQKMNIPPD
jgi:hypothetical protein